MLSWIASKLGKGILLTQLAGLALLIGLLALRIADPVIISNLRYQGFDLLQRMSPRPAVTTPVAIVDIDENSLEAYGQWPWPRTRIAELITKLAQRGVITTGFDIIFAEEDRLSPGKFATDNPNLPADVGLLLRGLPQNEQIMSDAMKRTRVVLGETSARQGQTERLASSEFGSAVREIEPVSIPFAQLGEDPTKFVLRFSRLVQNREILTKSASGLGVFTVVPEADGIIRRVPLVVEAQGKLRLTLSTEVLRIATGGRAFAVKSDLAGVSSIVVGGVEVPTDRRGRIWPWFNASTRDRYVSAAEVLSGTVDPNRLAGHMVLIGTSAVGLEDYRATPVASQMPGVEIHAQVLENILAKQFLIRPNYALGMELVFLAVAGIAIIWIVPFLGAVYSSIFAVIALGSFSAGSLWAFFSERLLLDGIYPVAAVTSLFILMSTGNYIREEIEKRRIRGAFGQYLSPDLVSQLADDPDLLVLGGQTRDLTLLFTDIRGFTGISESYKENPQGLTKLMNSFLNALSEPILDERGTIDKYMGDAIMAFWNAPLECEDHELKACYAAINMTKRLDAVNKERYERLKDSSDEPYHELNIGIGLNTGQCVVGNMGSDLRFDYTALGDTVNLASRLEGQSKPYGFPIIMGDNTAKAVEEKLAVLEIDLIRVKGKSEPERIHVLVGDEEVRASDDFQALRALNSMMLAAYRTQDWTTAYNALEEIEKVAERLGLQDMFEGYLFIYESRISEFRANPPGKSWDGVYDALTK